MVWSKDKHDVGILRSDGSTKVGFILAETKGVPVYQTFVDEYIAEPVRGEARVERELIPFRQDDWRSGISQEFFDYLRAKKYFSSKNMDMRFKGMGICSPKATAATLPTAIATPPSIANSDFESDSNWTGVAGSQQAAAAYEGSYGWQVTNGDVAQDLTWNAAYQSQTFYLYCYVKCSVASTGRISLYDGQSITYSAYHTGGGAWELLSVTKTFAANASIFKISLHSSTANAVYFDNIYLASTPSATIKSFADFNNNLHFNYGKNLYKVANATGTITRVGSFYREVTDLEPFTDDRLYIALGGDYKYLYMSTAEVFTPSDSKANYFKTVTDTMWKAILPRSIYSATDPTADANWSSATTIDTSTFDITGMVTLENSLYIMKEDRPFYLTGGGAVEVLIEDTKPIANSTSGKNSIAWHANLYMPWGGASLIEYDDGLVTWRSPAKFCTNLADYDGRVQALASDEEYLYAIVDNGTKVEVMAGREENVDGVTEWVWHPWVQLTLANCETAFVSSVFQKRLWIASTSSSDSLYYIPLYASYGDVTNDTNRDFQTGGELITPWLSLGYKSDDKAWIKIILTMEDTTNTIYYEAHYQKLGDSAWTDIGDFKTSPTTEKYLPVDASANKPMCIFMRFKFVPITDDVLVTPKILGYDIRAILYPSTRNLIACVIRCADDIILNDGTKERDNDAANIKAVLEEARDATWPFTFYEYKTGTAKTVRMLPTTGTFSRVVIDEKSKNPERHFNLLLQEISLS